jgi:hypothetical protein
MTDNVVWWLHNRNIERYEPPICGRIGSSDWVGVIGEVVD